MSDDLEFDVALKNEISGPANEAKKSLHALGDEGKSAGETVEKLGHHVEEAGKHAEHAKGFFEEFSKSLIPQIALGELAAEGLKKRGEAVLEGVKFAVEAAEFKENMVDAYGVIRGGVEEGEKTFRAIDDLARGLHMPTEKAHELAQSLMFQGLTNQKELTGTIEAVSNLQRAGLAEGAEHLKMAIERSLASGHFELQSRMLRGTGTSVDQVYTALAERLHITTDAVKREMAEGKISVDDGISAITEAINTSNIAELAHKKFTISDALTDIKNSVRGLFQEADSGPLVDAFRDVSEAIKPGTEGAMQFKEVLNDTIIVAGQVVDAVAGIARAAKAAAGEFYDLVLSAQMVGHTPAEQAAMASTIAEVERAKKEEAEARADMQRKSDEFDARWADKETRHAYAGGGGSVGGHVEKAKDKLDPELYGRSGGIGGQGALQWAAVLRELGLSTGGTTGAAAGTAAAVKAVAPKVGQVHMGGVTVQIHGVSHAEDILTLLPSALVDVLEQASNEAGA